MRCAPGVELRIQARVEEDAVSDVKRKSPIASTLSQVAASSMSDGSSLPGHLHRRADAQSVEVIDTHTSFRAATRISQRLSERPASSGSESARNHADGDVDEEDPPPRYAALRASSRVIE